jgi:hypothetical protein
LEGFREDVDEGHGDGDHHCNNENDGLLERRAWAWDERRASLNKCIEIRDIIVVEWRWN